MGQKILVLIRGIDSSYPTCFIAFISVVFRLSFGSIAFLLATYILLSLNPKHINVFIQGSGYLNIINVQVCHVIKNTLHQGLEAKTADD